MSHRVKPIVGRGRGLDPSAAGVQAELVQQESDALLTDAIRTLLAARAVDASICPSDAARAVGGDDWRELMDPARQAARRLSDAGEVEVTQRGEVVDLDTVRGPIRIRRAR